MASNQNSDVHVFGERDAGKYLGGERTPVSQRTLQRWRLEGVGPKFLKLGRLVRYRKSDLDRWADAQLRTSTSQAET
jgi:predicted DNA-binding transcriptional regulator AlpA